VLVRYWHTVGIWADSGRGAAVVSCANTAPGRLLRPRGETMPGHFIVPVRPSATLIAPEVFRLLNVEGVCRTPSDLASTGTPKLWVYNLHYFEDLNARDAAVRAPWHRQLLERWVKDNPAGVAMAGSLFPSLAGS